jgi:hypothetical protein
MYRLRHGTQPGSSPHGNDMAASHKPDVVIVPNGTVQELGIVYRVARHLNLQTVTYEFGDQRQRIWLAQNAEVMQQETDGLWNARQGTPLLTAQMERLQSLFVARQRASMWENFARLWQDTPAKGGEQARQALGLDRKTGGAVGYQCAG